MNKNELPTKKGNQSRIDYYKEHYGKGYKRIDREVDRLNGVKKCGGTCEKILPNTKKYFHKNSQTKDGLHYVCKNCRNDAKREYYQQKLKNLIRDK